MQVDDPGQPGACVLRVHGLEKAFGGVRALQGVDLDLKAGEVHALVGENGAGKSTLMRVVAGLERPDRGCVTYRDRTVRFRGPHEALASGIHLIHQELMLFPDLTLAENLFAGREPVHGWLRWVDRVRMRQRTMELLAQVGVDLDPDVRMGGLTVAQMQGVEIARALAHEVKVLIWDEPTSALSWRETQRLFAIVGQLCRRGVAQVYISHKLDEVFRLAHRITVLRDGRRVVTCRTGETTPSRLIEAMVGRPVSSSPDATRRSPRGPLLQVHGLRQSDSFGTQPFEVRRGEVVGLAGLVGAGRSEFVAGLYGLEKPYWGRVLLDGTELRVRHPADALEAGMAMVTEDRQRWGLVGTLSVEENLLLSGSAHRERRWWLQRASERELTREWAKRLSIRIQDFSQRVGELSGGNQQKVVLARALITKPTLLMLDEPTRGIDVGAKSEIYELIRELRDQGMGILLVSSELPELLALSDRILVMREGEFVGELAGETATEEAVLALAMPRRRFAGGERVSLPGELERSA